MKYIKIFIKPLLYTFGFILISLIILTLLNYYNMLNNGIISIIKITIPIVAFFIGGFLLGKSSKKKGWLEGLKFGFITILIFILINYIGFRDSFKFKSIIFYSTLIISSIFGSIFGINKKIDK